MSLNSTTKQCPECGVTFPKSKKNPHIRFCSHECYSTSRRVPIEYRLWSKVRKDDGCWEWKGAYSKTSGYGVISHNGKQTQPHRVAWELAHGPIPDGMYICHHCDNKKCVRPDHLFLGTPKENTADMIAKGRIARDDKMPQTKLSPNDVRNIRASSGKAKVIAAQYGISEIYVYQLRARKFRKHID